MKENFKTLIFKDNKGFAIIINVGSGNELGSCSIPQLMNFDVKLSDLKRLYPEVDFNQCRLITLVCREIQTSGA